MQRAVDEAILAHAHYHVNDYDDTSSPYYSNSASIKTNLNTFKMLKYQSLFAIMGVPNGVTMFGSTMLVLGLCTQLFMAFMMAMSEKETGVLTSMRRMGLVELSHWLRYRSVCVYVAALIAMSPGPAL